MSGQPEQMLDKLNQNKANLVDQRLLTITSIAFCGFMRFIINKYQDFIVRIWFLVALTSIPSLRKL